MSAELNAALSNSDYNQDWAQKIESPCPFCGTPARVEDGEHELNMRIIEVDDVSCAVQCIMCLSHGPKSSTDKEAVEDWNNRP